MNGGTISPDGKQVSFTWLGTNWVASADGGIAEPAAEQPFERGAGEFSAIMHESGALDPCVSPDGKRVAFRMRGDDLLRRRKGDAGSRAGEIWIYDGESGEYTSVVRGDVDCRRPVWLGEDEIAYLKADGKGGRDVVKMEIGSGKETQILSCSGGEPATGLSADDGGKTILVRRGFDLWKYRIGEDGKADEGKRLVFHPAEGAPHGRREHVRILRTAWNNGRYGRIERSPDWKDFIFTAGGAIWAIPAEGGEPRCLSGSARFQEKDPFFSADGSLVFHLREFGDRSEIWAMKREDDSKDWSDPENRIMHRCVVGGEGLRMGLSRSPDGKTISWMSVKGGFFFMPAELPANGKAGEPTEIKPEGTIACWEYSWSPDSSHVALVFVDGSRIADVWLADIKEPGKAVNVSFHAFSDGRARWAKGGRQFFFTGQWEICGGERYFGVDLDKSITKGCAYLLPRDHEKTLDSILQTEPDWRLPEFRIAQEIDLDGYRRLAFLKVWSGVKARIPAGTVEGTDWAELREKYIDAATHAAGWGEFMIVVQMMLGELDASHLVFRPTPATMKAWTVPMERKRRPKAYPGCPCCLAKEVHEKTGDRWGYVRIDDMSEASYDQFRNDLFREGRGREGIIIDIRGNGGGSYADAMIASLMTPAHGWSTWQDGEKGYIASHLERYFFAGKIILLIDEGVASNAEMFAHSLKTFKRATLVGRATAGSVLAASPFEVMDLGEYLMPVGRWWTEEGVEMEKNGAVPDVRVDDSPADRAAGKDPQLEKALELIDNR